MQKRIQPFDDLFHAICENGRKIRNGQWMDQEQSIEDWKEVCKEQSDFIPDIPASDAGEYRNARAKAESGS